MPDEAEKYIASLDKIRDNQDYELTWSNDDFGSDTGSSGETIGSIVIVLLVLIGLIIRWTQRR